MRLSLYILLFIGTLFKVNTQVEYAKFFFGTTKRPIPTSLVVHHEPGVPPGWTTSSLRPSRWFIGDKINPSYEAGQVLVESQFINITKPIRNQTKPEDYPEGVEPPEAATFDKDKNLVEWVLGLFKPNNPNTTQKPGEIINTSTEGVKCEPCSCGINYKHTRIVGGVVTQVNAYPWVAYLTYNGRFYCGGSLINDQYILTASHCVTGFSKERLKVILLDHDRSTTSESDIITRGVQTIFKHSNYNVGTTYNNDIALLKLDERVAFGDLLRPVCLPRRGETFTGKIGTVVGWGATESHGSVSNKLREVKVPILSLNECRSTAYNRDRITENMLCAGYPKGMKDSCQGDSGGPLHVPEGRRHEVVGIVSWGEGCALKDYPGVYTRVNRYITWIESNTKGSCYCQ
ncbi:trypsin-1-like [Onthophagus taurus]|uniref:trypsin-1-like n=1 Tax=Onthophagus taurus TaxID=166361 RepID=UPI000C203B60|nr:trypsin-1-like [Onthophagus taurus]